MRFIRYSIIIILIILLVNGSSSFQISKNVPWNFRLRSEQRGEPLFLSQGHRLNKNNKYDYYDDGYNEKEEEEEEEKEEVESKFRQSYNNKDDTQHKLRDPTFRPKISIVRSPATKILAEEDIADMKLLDLREACQDRGLPRTGPKKKLQERLMTWSNSQCLKQIWNHGASTSSNNKQSIRTRVIASNRQKIKLNRGNKDGGEMLMTYSEMYEFARKAEIRGDLETAKDMLNKCAELDPDDGRIPRRLARFAYDSHDYTKAMEILQEAVYRMPDNAYLWHALGVYSNKIDLKRRYFEQATKVEPLPNTYHAWGRMEQVQANDHRAAARLFRTGVKMFPKNHRLWHALGTLQCQAGLYGDAEASFKEGMKYGPPYSRGFFGSSLAYNAYVAGQNVEVVERYLRLAVDSVPLHAQGWLSLAKLLEYEGRSPKYIRKVYVDGSSAFEHSLRRKRSKRMCRKSGSVWPSFYKEWATFEQEQLLLSEKFEDFNDENILAEIGVAKSLSSLLDDSVMKKYGMNPHANLFYDVYRKSLGLFPSDVGVLLHFANEERPRLYEEAIETAPTHTQPYIAYAQYLIRKQDYLEARKILVKGYKAIKGSFVVNNQRFSEMVHLWGLIECKILLLDVKSGLKEKGTLEKRKRKVRDILDKALSLSSDGKLKSAIYNTLAKFEFWNEKYFLSKHFLCLSLSYPESQRNDEKFDLFSRIASKLGNEALADTCAEEKRKMEEQLSDCVLNPSSKIIMGRGAWEARKASPHKRKWAVLMEEQLFPKEDENSKQEFVYQ